MSGIYEVELECKKGNATFVRNAIISGMLGVSWIDSVIRNAQELGAETVVVYLSDGEDLLDLWEINVTAEDCGIKIRRLLQQVGKSIERKEQRKAYA